MDFNFDNERPIYIQLVKKLRLAIITAKYPLGSRLPSVRDLALEAKVNPNTLQKALGELESDGLIYTERTNGKYVTNDSKLVKKFRSDMAKDIVRSFISDMKNIGYSNEEIILCLKEKGEK